MPLTAADCRKICRPQEQSRWQKFRCDPIAQSALWLYSKKPLSPNACDGIVIDGITAVCISDTHLSQPHVPHGELLLHAGDLSNKGSFEELQTQLDWLASLPHRHKVIIAGNHDRLLDATFIDKFPERMRETPGAARTDLNWHDLHYLQNETISLTFANGRLLKIFGSPLTPDCGMFAFQYLPIRDVWTGAVPLDCDVVLTHGPPKGYLDQGGKGCPYLLEEIVRKRPRFVVYGHIHAGNGQQILKYRGIEDGYQRVMTGHAGIVTILSMTVSLVTSWITSSMPFLARRMQEQQTILVNAALGADAEQDDRHAIVLQM